MARPAFRRPNPVPYYINGKVIDIRQFKVDYSWHFPGMNYKATACGRDARR
jgi:hypothetical protein